jgi:hypothetical protein
MTFISQDIFSIDYIAFKSSKISEYVISDTFDNHLPSVSTYKFNGNFNIRFIDPVFIFNAGYISNKNQQTVSANFALNYESERYIYTQNRYEFKYRYPFVNYETSVEFNIPFDFGYALDGSMNFTTNYKYHIDDSVFIFDTPYSHNHIYSHYNKSFGKFVYQQQDGWIMSEDVTLKNAFGFIYRTNIFDFNLFNVNELVSWITNRDSAAPTLITIQDIVDFLKSKKEMLVFIVNNGSFYQSLSVPVINRYVDYYSPVPISPVLVIKEEMINVSISSLSNNSSLFNNASIDIPVFTIYMSNVDFERPVSAQPMIIKIDDSIEHIDSSLNMELYRYY